MWKLKKKSQGVNVTVLFVAVNLLLNFAGSGLGWNCGSILILLESCLQTCMAYTIAECTVKILMMDRGTVRNMHSFIPK
jgi:hypothetical protein